MPAVHLRHPTIVPAAEPEEGHGVPFCRPWDVLPVVELLDPTVTCKRCPKLYARWLTERALEQPEVPEEPFVPTGELHHVPNVRGRHVLGEREVAVLRRSIAGHEERRYPWRSAADAIRELVVFRADGAGTKSTSKPERFERAPKAGYDHDPTRVIAAQVDRIHGVDAAVRGAYEGDLVLTFQRDDADEDGRAYALESVIVSAEQQTTILLWLHEYTMEPNELKSRGQDRVPVTPLIVTRRARSAWGLVLSERQVRLIRNRGLDRVSAHLRNIEELAPDERLADTKPKRREGERPMAVRGYDLEGWKEIADHLGIGEDTCHALNTREGDPLPVHRVEGVKRVQARRDELDAWIRRNAQQRGAGAA